MLIFGGMIVMAGVVVIFIPKSDGNGMQDHVDSSSNLSEDTKSYGATKDYYTQDVQKQNSGSASEGHSTE